MFNKLVLSSIQNMISAPQPIATRLATLEDVPALAEIGVRTFRDTFAQYNTEEDMQLYLEKTFTHDQLLREMNDPASTFVLAKDGDVVVGYAKLREGKNPSELNEENGIEIERIYSSKDFLGKNVGKALMQTCLSIAQQRGYTLVWLGVWEYNPRAITFYEKWGFKKFGAHSFLLGNDLQTDILMKKILT